MRSTTSNDVIHVKPYWGYCFWLLIISFVVRNIDTWKFGTAPQYIFPVWQCMIILRICVKFSLCHIICFVISMTPMWYHYIFICFIYVIWFFTRTSALRILALIFQFFKYLLLQDRSNDRNKYYNIIISDYTFHSLFPPQLKQMYHNTRSCVVVNVSFILKVYIHRCYPGVIGIWKNSEIKAKILKSEGLVRKHITYMKHIKYSDATWASYLCQSIWYGKFYNLHISSVWSCTSTLEMCIAVLC